MIAFRQCRLGSPTENDRAALMAASPLICSCEASCEPHEHSGNGPEDWTICLHDGVTDHAHCPNVALDSLTDGDA